MDNTILVKAGLTPQESKVYLHLIELGTTSAGPLIKKAGLHRAVVYNLLDLLINKGLVSYIIKRKKKYFQAEAFNKLTEFIKNKKSELEKQEEEIQRIIPEMEKIRSVGQQLEGAVYEGKNGLKNIFEDIIKQKNHFYVWGASGSFKKLFPTYFNNFHKTRIKLKISMSIIFSEKIRIEQREQELQSCKIKYISDEYINPSTTYVYGSRVVIIHWSEKPLAFMIKQQEIAEAYKKYFKLLWELSKK
ncbi:hypothetical protein K9L97_00480 [Candidatus Woesearchaeota archaeon]|nr:hypothetical protein [Candidatus Woesearchaeota archaeon]